MGRAAVVVGLLGLGNVLSPMLCVGDCRPNPMLLDALAVIGGVCLLAIAYGMWKRLLWAWYLGFLVIVLGAVYFVAHAATLSPGSSISLSIAGAMAAVVAVGLSFWWYQWRNQFGRPSGI